MLTPLIDKDILGNRRSAIDTSMASESRLPLRHKSNLIQDVQDGMPIHAYFIGSFTAVHAEFFDPPFNAYRPTVCSESSAF